MPRRNTRICPVCRKDVQATGGGIVSLHYVTTSRGLDECDMSREPYDLCYVHPVETVYPLAAVIPMFEAAAV